MFTIADEWIREGEQKGLLQGLQQGLQQGLTNGKSQGGISQGELAVLRHQLTRRFGPLPVWAEARPNAVGQSQAELRRCLGDQKIDVVVENKLSSSIQNRAKQQGEPVWDPWMICWTNVNFICWPFRSPWRTALDGKPLCHEKPGLES